MRMQQSSKLIHVEPVGDLTTFTTMVEQEINILECDLGKAFKNVRVFRDLFLRRHVVIWVKAPTGIEGLSQYASGQIRTGFGKKLILTVRWEYYFNPSDHTLWRKPELVIQGGVLVRTSGVVGPGDSVEEIWRDEVLHKMGAEMYRVRVPRTREIVQVPALPFALAGQTSLVAFADDLIDEAIRFSNAASGLRLKTIDLYMDRRRPHMDA